MAGHYGGRYSIGRLGDNAIRVSFLLDYLDFTHDEARTFADDILGSIEPGVPVSVELYEADEHD
jgi:hypothetical protein